MVAASLLVAACAGTNDTHLDADAGVEPPAVFDCLPDLDGEVTADEMPIALDNPVQYLIGNDRPVDFAGTDWDWTADTPDDKQTLTAVAVRDQWYASAFPGAQFASALDAAGTLDGVYVQDDAALWLLGIASVQPDRTLLAYDAPVALFRFPLAPGAAWTSVGEVIAGTLDGLPYVGTDTYDVEVDAVGTLALPHLAFEQVHRVRTRVEVAPAVGGITLTRRQVSLVFECFGEVGRATSRDDEPQTDFSTAAELRRLSL